MHPLNLRTLLAPHIARPEAGLDGIIEAMKPDAAARAHWSSRGIDLAHFVTRLGALQNQSLSDVQVLSSDGEVVGAAYLEATDDGLLYGHLAVSDLLLVPNYPDLRHLLGLLVALLSVADGRVVRLRPSDIAKQLFLALKRCEDVVQLEGGELELQSAILS